MAVVSGCDTGLGQGMAVGLAEAGCDIVGINIVEPTETIERVTALGRRFLSLTADLRQIDGIPQLLERAVAEFGHIDILVNNAGGGGPKPFDMPMADFRRAYELNVFSFFHLSQLVAPEMEKNGGGVILTITSMAAENKNKIGRASCRERV